MKQKISSEQAANQIKDGSVLMIGGFLGVGSPLKLIDAIVAKGVKNLTIICNDTAMPDKGIGKLVVNNQVKKLITSHIGTNPSTMDKMNAGEIEIEFCPQGTLAERVRAGGAGLGGVLTPTGLGTVVEKGKQIIKVDGVDFLLEKPIRADFALIGASVSDEEGNLVYKGTSQNFNPLMATAADVVMVEPLQMVAVNEIAPENVKTPSIFVDYIIS